jgi:hypothetical protein
MSTTPKLFEDGVFYTDRSKFIDYPKVKIRSYEEQESKKNKKIILLTFLFSTASAMAILFLVYQ